jgi:hypothetical protein
MELVLETSGGFMGLVAGPVRVDTAQLEASAAKNLEFLVHNSRFFDQPERAAAPADAADFQIYTLMVREGGRCHQIEVTDPIADPALAQLILALEEFGRPTSRRGGG